MLHSPRETLCSVTALENPRVLSFTAREGHRALIVCSVHQRSRSKVVYLICCRHLQLFPRQ